MFPNYPGLGCAALALFVFGLTYRRASSWPTPARWRWFAIAALAALPACYNALYYTHKAPEFAWFYEIRSWRGSEALVVFAGAAGALWATLLRRRFLILPLLATALVAFGPFIKPLFGPMETGRLRDTWIQQVYIQSTLSTCGPASTATVLKSLRLAATEAEIARAAHTYVGGTEAWYLARYLRSRGLNARFVKTAAGFPAELRPPAIVGVTVSGRGHFVAFLSRAGDTFEIGDPMIGPERLTREKLERRYEFTGFVLEVSRPPERTASHAVHVPQNVW